MVKADMFQVSLSGYCYRCGTRRFNETCLEFPLPPDWFDRALTRLKGRGWVFLVDEDHGARAYCKHCWEATEG